jgi:phospholipid/cholesterol/gamma-HCH transport system substrate-binding protein
VAQRRSLAWTELRVGILVISSFALLALAIFFITGESGFLTPKYTVKAYFQNANNLKAGADVQLEGVTVGTVGDVQVSKLPDPEKAVEATLRLDQKYQNIIRSDSKVTIATIGLLGDSKVDITRGTEAGTVIPPGGELQGAETGDIRKIVQGTNDFVANLQVLSDKFRDMADRVDKGEGTLGKFMTDSAIYDNANLTVQEAASLVRDAHTGNGTVGRLISDDQLYQKVSSTMDTMNNLLAKIENGQGTAGKFINDPSVYKRTDEVLMRFQAVTDRIERGEGTLGKLSKDEGFYNDARATMMRFNNLISAIENGDGTAGKIIKDPTLYNSLNQTSSEIQKLLYDFRQNPKKFLTISFKLF